MEANWQQEHFSEEEDSSETHVSIEDSSEEQVSVEEDSSEEQVSVEEDSSEEQVSVEEDSSEEHVSEEEFISEEEDGLPKHTFKEASWFEDYYFNENWLKEHGFGVNWEEVPTLDENWIEEHGFVFKKKIVETKECVVEIVLIGKENCGKTHLIETVFGEHPSLTVTNHETRDEYRIHLSENLSFHVWLYDVKDIEFVKKAYFRYKTVFIICYAYDDPESLTNLQEIWIPLLLQKCKIRMFHFVAGIEGGTVAKPKTVTVPNSREHKLSMRDKAAELLRRFRGGQLVECSTDDKKSMMNVFQSAFDVVYPCLPSF